MNAADVQKIVGNTPGEIEQFIRKVCNDDFIDIEFDYPYEPEIKLKIVAAKLRDFAAQSLTAGESARNVERTFINTIFGILKRIDPVSKNFNFIYRLILAIDLIKPADGNHIIKELIEQAKFLNLTTSNDNYNLHIELVNVYFGLIADDEDIDFAEGYLKDEFKNRRLFIYPNFISVFLRFFIKFRSSDYFHALEDIIPFVTDKSKAFRVSISLSEYVKARRSYKELLNWLSTSFEKMYRTKPSEQVSLVLDTISDWVARKKTTEKSNYLPLISAELTIIKDEYDLLGVVACLEEFCGDQEINRLDLRPLKNAFFDFLRKLRAGRFNIVDEIDEEKDYFAICIEYKVSRPEKAKVLFNKPANSKYLMVPMIYRANFEDVLTD